MSMVIKYMVRITNGDGKLLSSLAILIIPLTARLIKEIPGLECRPIVPTKTQKDFFGQNLKPFFLRNCNNMRIKDSYVQKIVCFILSKFEYHLCIW